MKKTTILALIVPSVLAFLAFFPIENKKNNFHTAAEMDFFKKNQSLLSIVGAHDPEHQIPIDSNILFPTAKLCGGCHGRDPNGHALVSTSGVDVNVYDAWRSTMMANSSKDPFWRAKVSHEILANPAHSLQLQDKCTSCHAPSGHYQAKLKDHKEYYGLADLYADTLGLDGVSCQTCHAQSPAAELGNLHSGALPFDTNHIRVAYGPYEFVFAPPMHNFVGITPKYGAHINDAGICAGCHTLITETADLNGAPTGQTFVEQATYHEWLNSSYDKQHLNISCQSCHIPRLNDEIIISTNYQFLTPKFPYGLHEMAGANTMMLKLLKENREKLGIDALPAHFDSTIAATFRMLKEKSLDIELKPRQLFGDTAYFSLKIVNKAGHKFPSGYPARRAWVEFEVLDASGNTIFHSGKQTADYGLVDENPNFEPHYNVINRENQVQIYELVPGDVTNAFSNILERGSTALKDNRLTPKGFSVNDPVYDTTRIVGNAAFDPDFNHAEDGTEGTGADVLHFHIPMNGYLGYLTVRSKIWYQSLSPKFVKPMFDYSSTEIDSFKLMYDQADQSPVLMAESVLDSVFVNPVSTKSPENKGLVQVFPNPTRNGRITARAAANTKILSIKAYSLNGQLVANSATNDLTLPEKKGVYLIVVQSNKGQFVEKILRQ